MAYLLVREGSPEDDSLVGEKTAQPRDARACSDGHCHLRNASVSTVNAILAVCPGQPAATPVTGLIYSLGEISHALRGHRALCLRLITVLC